MEEGTGEGEEQEKATMKLPSLHAVQHAGTL